MLKIVCLLTINRSKLAFDKRRMLLIFLNVAIVAIIFFLLDLNETPDLRFNMLTVCYIWTQCELYACEQSNIIKPLENKKLMHVSPFIIFPFIGFEPMS